MRSPTWRRGNIAGLDLLRGGAALYVAAYHSVGALTPSGLHFDTEGGSLRLILGGNPLGLFGFGFYAVLAFFVLSGFVVHLRRAERPEELELRGRLGWTLDYGWRRALRIYPPLLAALALTAGLGAAGSRLHADWPWPAGTLTDARNVLVPVYGPSTFGNAGTLWSVAFELWFYLAYVPIVLVVLGPLRDRRTLGMGVALAGTSAVAAALMVIQGQAPQVVPDEVQGLVAVAIYLPAWVAGAFLAHLYASGVRLPRPGWLAGAAGALIVVAAPHSGNHLRPAVDVLWGLGICMLIAALTLGRDRDRDRDRDRRVGWRGRLAASTASWSYSLYLVHLPVIYFAQAALGDGPVRTSDPMVVLGIFLVAVGAGWVFSLAVERPSLWLAARPPRRLVGLASLQPANGGVGAGQDAQRSHRRTKHGQRRP